MKLKHDNNVGKMFFIFSEFSGKGLVDLNATFSRSSDEVLALLCKPRKLKSANEIIAFLHDKSM